MLKWQLYKWAWKEICKKMAKFVARMVVFFDKIFLFTFVQQICIRKNNSMNVYNMASFLHSDLFHFTNYWKSPLSPSLIHFHHSPPHTLSLPTQGSPAFQFLSGVSPFEPRWLKCDVFFGSGQQEKKRVSHFLSGSINAFSEVSPGFHDILSVLITATIIHSNLVSSCMYW